MDTKQNKAIEIAKRYIVELENNNIPVLSAYLFGSYAKGNYRKDSDIDIAVISDIFSGDRMEDRIKIEPFRWNIDLRIEQIPFTPEKFSKDWHPFVWEIKNYGIKIK